MDSNLQRTALKHYLTVMDSVLTQEETTESIVPDSFPDVSRIVGTTGDAVIQSKQCLNGSVVITGVSMLTVLYIPEGENLPRALSLTLPFRCSGDGPKISSSTTAHVSVLSLQADARPLNPRKLFVRAEVKLSVTAYNIADLNIVSDIQSDSENSIQKQIQMHKTHLAAAVVEKPFMFSEVLKLPESKPAMDEILILHKESITAEAKYIGKRLICKGEVAFTAVYRNGDSLLPAKFELPFSQILDLEADVDEGETELTVVVKNIEFYLEQGALTVTVEILIQSVLWASCTIPVLCDLYSTTAHLDTKRDNIMLCVSSRRSSKRESVRKFCESGIPAKQILSCFIATSPVTVKTASNLQEYSADAIIDILYLSEDGALCFVNYKIPSECNESAAPEEDISCRCRPAGEAVAVPVTGGFEVRAELEYCWSAVKSASVSYITAAEFSPQKKSEMQRPSVVIRMVSSGESLWEVAKSCGSTIDDICAVNGLSSDVVQAGTVLLIPTKR